MRGQIVFTKLQLLKFLQRLVWFCQQTNVSTDSKDWKALKYSSNLNYGDSRYCALKVWQCNAAGGYGVPFSEAFVRVGPAGHVIEKSAAEAWKSTRSKIKATSVFGPALEILARYDEGQCKNGLRGKVIGEAIDCFKEFEKTLDKRFEEQLKLSGIMFAEKYKYNIQAVLAAHIFSHLVPLPKGSQRCRLDGQRFRGINDLCPCGCGQKINLGYTGLGFNEESLSSLADMESETNVTSLLTNHLLSQLIHRPANYIIDSRYTRKPYGGCPCGCRKQIQFGTTNIGSQLFFYGRADVILFPSSSDIFNAETNSSPAVFQLEHGKHMIKPGIKRLDKNWKLEENLEEDDICSGESKHDAFDAKTINQVCKQAISLSLWKHRRLLYNNIKNNNGDTVSMIPVCALNKEKCFVTMYNVQSDYLLIMKEINFLDIFKGGNLQFSTIINLWLLIHHSLFCTPPDEDAKEKLAGTCNLIRHLGKESFESIVKTSKFAYDIQPDVPKDKHTQIRKIHAGKKRPKLFPED